VAKAAFLPGHRGGGWGEYLRFRGEPGDEAADFGPVPYH
jgi:hypothetical protein